MNLYQKQFAKELNFEGQNETKKTLVICSTPRCGSHMLGHALYETQKFGFPLEYANPANLAEWKSRLEEEDTLKVMEKLKTFRTSDNGVFGIKLHYRHLAQFESFEQVLETFEDPYFVVLTRDNLLKQAVSLDIANQSGIWIDGQEPISDDVEFEPERIREALKDIIIDSASWKYLLSIHNCRFIDLRFSDVAQDVSGSIMKIAKFMGVNIEPSSISPNLATKKQASSINQEWFDDFIEQADKSDTLLSDFVKKGRYHKIKDKLSSSKKKEDWTG